MDIFSLGCILYELIELRPLFPGISEIDQINRIHEVLGTPSPIIISKLRCGATNNPIKKEFKSIEGCGIERMMTHPDSEVVDLIGKMLAYDPEIRITAA